MHATLTTYSGLKRRITLGSLSVKLRTQFYLILSGGNFMAEDPVCELVRLLNLARRRLVGRMIGPVVI